ncbi:MAG: double-strand break repair helicase AddA [Sphingomonadaceae bacterium]
MAGSADIGPHAALKGVQRDASDPERHVWLAASAGTGKTYVLSARVLRLLLRGVKPDAILCLTFTKAGATEMAERVHSRLAHWVGLKPADLAAELKALDEDFGIAEIARARTLFASVLEARGGGLRIMTIHAFCQTLLAGFPLEAGLAPGFRPIEGREQAALERQVIAEIVVTGDPLLIADLRVLSLRLGEAAALGFLSRAAKSLENLEALGPGLEAHVRRGLGLSSDPLDDDVVGDCTDGNFDEDAIMALVGVLSGWGKTGEKRADIITEWLLGTPAQRAAELAALHLVWTKADGDLRSGKGQVPPDAGYEALAIHCADWCGALLSRQRRATLAHDIAAALRAARAYARAYAEAKRVRGFVDFDDLIARTRALLDTPGMGDWIRYKLDQTTDHVLVDEAQDTNADQWAIVHALAGEFFAGEGAKGDTTRTLFAVGDFKQAIFGFQGTDPRHYKRAGFEFALAAVNAGDEVLELSLNQSFRSSPPVLAVVDAVMEALGPEAVGIDDGFEAHVSARGGPGEVLLLPPVQPGSDAEVEGDEDWLPDAPRMLATSIALQVKAWLAEDDTLSPGDIMILCRKRGALAALLVARLTEERVPVAGVDRLMLQAPLAVQDLVAAMRFVAQPGDDLNLAALLVSPLIGWSQQALYDVAYDRRGGLWDAIPEGDMRNALRAMLAAADLVTPHGFIEALLSGPLQARAKILARLGEEARDPIDELLNAALQFEREGVGSIQQFIDAFDRGQVEIKRDAGAAGDAVRVMTVHGAKGLQAPLVILADACADPDAALDRDFKWTLDGVAADLPLFRPRTAERALVESLQRSAEDADDRARREHWRLLYVAMTRAERRLVVAGSLGPRAKGEAPADSWHAKIEAAMRALGARAAPDPRWGEILQYGDLPSASPGSSRQSTGSGPSFVEKPHWLAAPAPQEARPPRPLAPSSIGIDDMAHPPAGPAMLAAAERGRLLHALFERLPPVAPSQRHAAGLAWLGNAEGAEALVKTVLAILDDPAFAHVFAPDALAEVPVAGVVDGLVIAGAIDRLVITEVAVEIVDFKTGRRVPATLDAIPEAHIRQMAAYAALLTGVFPGKAIRATLIYTEGPSLHVLPDALLEAHKPRFAGTQ